MLATLRSLTEQSGSTFNEDNPFYFVDIWGDTSFEDDDRLRLNDKFDSDSSGRFYMIVKAEYEVRLRIRSANWGYFKDSDQFTSNIKAAYDITFDTPFIADGKYKSSITATFRGGAMLAVTVDGDKGKWHTKDSSFSLEADNRNVPMPNIYFKNLAGTKLYNRNGVLMSLTAPFGDYNTLTNRNFVWHKADADMRVDLISYSKNEGEIVDGIFDGPSIVPTTGGVVDSDNTYVEPFLDLSGWSSKVNIDSGVDVNGDPWRVQLYLNRDTDMWHIFVDGTMIENGYSDGDDNGYEEAVKQARLVSKSRRERAEVKDQDENSSKDMAFAIGAGSIIVIAIAILVVVIAK